VGFPMIERQFIRPQTIEKVSLTEIWRVRNMVSNLIRSSALLPYSNTYFSYLWTLLRPFIFLGVIVFIKQRSGGNMGEEIPYPLFLYSGLILWWYLVDAIKQSARSVFTYQGLISKIYFPRVIAPAVPVFGILFCFVKNIQPHSRGTTIFFPKIADRNSKSRHMLQPLSERALHS